MNLQITSIAQHAEALRLAAVGAQFASLAEEAAQHDYYHLHYLEALLQAEVEDRDRDILTRLSLSSTANLEQRLVDRFHPQTAQTASKDQTVPPSTATMAGNKPAISGKTLWSMSARITKPSMQNLRSGNR